MKAGEVRVVGRKRAENMVEGTHGLPCLPVSRSMHRVVIGWKRACCACFEPPLPQFGMRLRFRTPEQASAASHSVHLTLSTTRDVAYFDFIPGGMRDLDVELVSLDSERGRVADQRTLSSLPGTITRYDIVPRNGWSLRLVKGQDSKGKRGPKQEQGSDVSGHFAGAAPARA